MAEKYLIGIDVGTSGTKSVLFDTKGNVIASATEEYPLYQPHNGWAEQDPEDWWNAVCITLSKITQSVNTAEIAGIGLSGQMHGLVMLDRNCNVIRKSIIWCDSRTARECEEIESLVGHDRLIEITANPALAGFTASKILWVRNNEPENYSKCAHILLPKDYIRFKLTGEFATEVSDASGMQLLDIPGRCWSDEVLEKLSIDKSLLAKVYESPDITGYITDNASVVTGLPVGIPVAGGAGDNAAAAVGTGVVECGKAFTTVGTSGVVFAHMEKPVIDRSGRVHTFCTAVPGQWHVMGVTQAAGLSLNWFKKTIADNLSYKEIDAQAENIAVGADRLLYLPYLMGERTPVLDTNARGVFFGLSAIHTKAHMARAVLEGVAFSLCDCLHVLSEMGVEAKDMALCGGGAKSPLWRKILCDSFGVSVKTMESDEGPALGAAILGGCAAGIYSSVAEGCSIAVRDGKKLDPDVDNHKIYNTYYNIYKQIYPALKEQYKNFAVI
ncbi:MAG: xylulokinase [Ruminococcaceae bacterium]|nr:xylulokinase [Oscillospiraceae bacterium]